MEEKIKGFKTDVKIEESITVDEYLSLPGTIAHLYTPVYEQPYKKGEWVYGEIGAKLTFVAKYNYKEGNRVYYSCLLYKDGEFSSLKDWFHEDCLRGIATEEQKLQHFSAAARKKGFVEGVRVKTESGFNHTIRRNETKLYNMTTGEDVLLMGDIIIFNSNTLQWAEIVQPKEVFKIEYSEMQADSKPKKSIDNVTTKYLDVAFRACGIDIPIEVTDKIIDLVELIEEKGGETHLMDICKLQAEWEKK